MWGCQINDVTHSLSVCAGTVFPFEDFDNEHFSWAAAFATGAEAASGNKPDEEIKMNYANMDSITVNNRKYSIDLLNPMEAIAWSSRAASLFLPLLEQVAAGIDWKGLAGLDLEDKNSAALMEKLQGAAAAIFGSCGKIKSKETSDMMNEAIQRCYTPENEPLANMEVYNRHFREYPEDLLILGMMAIGRLVRDFFPKLSAIGGMRSLMTGTEKAA